MDVICIWGVVLVLIGEISLLSSWDDMNVPAKLLADDVWVAEDDKIGVLSVGVDIFDTLYF